MAAVSVLEGERGGPHTRRLTAGSRGRGTRRKKAGEATGNTGRPAPPWRPSRPGRFAASPTGAPRRAGDLPVSISTALSQHGRPDLPQRVGSNGRRAAPAAARQPPSPHPARRSRGPPPQRAGPTATAEDVCARAAAAAGGGRPPASALPPLFLCTMAHSATFRTRPTGDLPEERSQQRQDQLILVHVAANTGEFGPNTQNDVCRCPTSIDAIPTATIESHSKSHNFKQKVRLPPPISRSSSTIRAALPTLLVFYGKLGCRFSCRVNPFHRGVLEESAEPDFE